MSFISVDDPAGGSGGDGVKGGQFNFQNFNQIINKDIYYDDDDDGDDFTHDFPRLNNFNLDNFDYYSIDKINTLFNKHNNINKSLKIVHFNIRGLVKNFDNLILYLSSLDHTFDVITLSECHITLNNNIDNRYKIEGYDNFFVYSNIKFGGCVIYSKTHLGASQIKSLTKSTNSCDFTFINIPNNNRNKAINIGVFYRHCLNNKIDMINFINELENSLENDCIKKDKLVITGDFNADLCQINTSIDITTYFNCLLSNNLECHIVKPTRLQYYPNSLQIKSATLIDHISSNLFEFTCTAGNLFYSNSDHFPNFVVFDNFFDQPYKPNRKCNVTTMRHLNKIDNHKLEYDINSIDWYGEVCNDELDLNVCTTNLINHIQVLCNRHAPKVKCSKRKAKYCFKPWIDNELLHLIKTKNILYRKKKKVPTELNNINFSKARTKVNNSLRHKKKAYFEKYFNEYRRNAKKMWKGIYDAMEVTKIKKSIPLNIKDNKTGQTYNQPKVIANHFAEYFEQVPLNIRNNIPTSIPSFTNYLPQSTKRSMYFYETNPNEVFDLINKLKNNCSTGDIDIPNQFLKLIAFPLSYIIAYIANRSIISGYMPNILKVGKQTPIFKSGENCFSNYRPITVVNSISKIIEKLVGKRLISYLEKFELLNKNQFGFRKKHSTIHAMIN